MPITLCKYIFNQYFDDNGDPLAGGKLYTYQGGTVDTEKVTYEDAEGNTSNTNPIILDAAGRCSIFLDSGAYKFVLKNSADVTIETKDNVYGQDTTTEVDSLTDLKALAVGNIPIVRMLGYYTPNDGGGGVFYYDSTSAATADNGAVVLPDSNPVTGRWLLIHSKEINIRQYGCKVDGSTDDTATAQLCDTYCQANDVSVVVDGTIQFDTDPSFLSKIRLTPGAIIQYNTGLNPTLDLDIPTSDLSQHFNCLVGDVPVLNLNVIQPEWFGETIASRTKTSAAIDTNTSDGILIPTLNIEDNAVIGGNSAIGGTLGVTGLSTLGTLSVTNTTALGGNLTQSAGYIDAYDSYYINGTKIISTPDTGEITIGQTANGLIGINTTSPLTALHVHYESIDNGGLFCTNSNSDYIHLFNYERANVGTIFGGPKNGVMGILGAPNVDMKIGTLNATSTYLCTNNAVRMAINSSGVATFWNNVGIGITPTQPLHVSGNALITGASTLASLSVTGAATVGTTLGVTGVSTLSGNVGIGITPTQPLHVSGNALITGDIYTTAGNVGIGTSPSYLLHLSDTLPEFYMYNTSGSNNASFKLYSSELDIISSTHLYLGSGGTKSVYMSSSTQNFAPATDNTISCGTVSKRWTAVYAVNGTIQTSDERMKRSVQDSNLGLDFINKLRPVSYMLMDDEEKSKKRRYGLIAQEVNSIIGESYFAGTIYDKENDMYGLNYSEFIAPLVRAVQETSSEIDKLKNKIKSLEKQLKIK